MTISLIPVQREVFQRDVHSSCGRRRPRIRRGAGIGRSIVYAVIIGARLYEEARSAAQSSIIPIPTARKEEPRDQRASVDDKSDRIARRRASHRGIDTGTIIGSSATCVFVAPIFQAAIESAADF